MLLKILSVVIFILLTWHIFESSEDKKQYYQSNEDLNSVVSKNQLLQNSNHDLLRKLADQQNEHQLLIQKLALNVDKINKNLNKVVTNTTNNVDQEKKTEVNEKKPVKALEVIISDLKERLNSISNKHKNKSFSEAISGLEALKKELWKLTKHKSINKADVLQIMAAVDITIKKWKSNESDFGTDYIEQKLLKVYSAE